MYHIVLYCWILIQHPINSVDAPSLNLDLRDKIKFYSETLFLRKSAFYKLTAVKLIVVKFKTMKFPK